MKIFNRFDKTNLLLVSFILLLATLFIYLFKVEKDIQYYTAENEKIFTLELIDKEFNDFTLSINQFDNYDAINSKISLFKKTLNSLTKDISLHYPDSALLTEQVQKIKFDFEKKIEDLDYFKSLNASLLNSSHLLFDLQRTISESNQISSDTKSLINEALFYLLKYTSSEYIDKFFVQKKLQETLKIAQKTKQTYLLNFYKISLLMLDTLSELKQTSSSIQKNSLNTSLQTLNQSLSDIYTNNLHIQKMIGALFFIAAILMLIGLIKMHFVSLKRQKELLAFKYAMQHSDNTIVITDAQRHITFVNDVFVKITGYSKEEALGQNPNILKSGLVDESIYIEMNKKLDSGQKWEGEFINKKKDGSLFYEKASIVPVFLNNTLINYLAIKLDITNYIEQNKKLAQAATIFENTEETIIITDKDGKVISVNNAFSDIYGYKLPFIRGKNLSFLQSGEQDKNFYTDMWHQLIEKGVWKGKLINKSKSGDIIPVWTTIKRISDEKGNIINYTAVQTDLRELQTSQAKADYLAYHDALTGLYNRVNFEEYLSHALSVAKRNEALLAVLFIDLDRFKIINDTLGHDIGDEVLITIASRLKKTLRESDFISRWGGDEFVVILENLAIASNAAIVAASIIEHLQEPIELEEHSLITTASIGISLFPENGEDPATLIKHADSAMYQAKESGKNQFCYYTKELSKGMQRKLDIDLALRNALENNEFYMLFQPQYKLDTKTIHSVEALIRWNNKKMGIISPDTFIPIAEENGTIVKLGYFVFEESCKAFKKMKKANPNIKYIAINVSSLQFKEAHLLTNFIALAKRYEVEPNEIEIEITERFIMEHTIANMNVLQSFRNYGFKISFDDFGTGYSSMSYLKRLPVDTIKIDKSFVDDIDIGSSDNVIIEAIIALSKTLGYSIVAEGIETPEQESFLTKASCDLGQGYLFSRPVSCNEIIEKF